MESKVCTKVPAKNRGVWVCRVDIEVFMAMGDSGVVNSELHVNGLDVGVDDAPEVEGW